MVSAVRRSHVCFCVCVSAGTRERITSANLGAVTSEDGNEISYSLIRPPRLGRLILANDRNQYEEITRFSQSQVITFQRVMLNGCLWPLFSSRRY